MQSILEKATPADVIAEPFPHLVLEEALDAGLYEELARQFPPAKVLVDGREPASNAYYHFKARRALGNPDVSPLWREFIARHVGREFFRQAMALFGDHVRALHPHLEERLGKRLEDVETSIRHVEEPRDVALECQLTYCSPVASPSTSASPHVDREVALYAGLLYFRQEGDDSAGGDLELYRFQGDGGEPREFRADRSVPESCLEKRVTVPYRANTLVFFLHSPRSVHGVSPRSATPFPRLHVNFVAELRDKVFDLTSYRTPCRVAAG